MIKRSILILFTCCNIFVESYAQGPDSLKEYSAIIKKHIYNDYKGMFREAKGTIPFPFITPGSDQYANDLWDWDSWLSNIALRQILSDAGSEKEKKAAVSYERGCVLNFLHYASSDGYIPIVIFSN